MKDNFKIATYVCVLLIFISPCVYLGHLKNERLKNIKQKEELHYQIEWIHKRMEQIHFAPNKKKDGYIELLNYISHLPDDKELIRHKIDAFVFCVEGLSKPDLK